MSLDVDLRAKLITLTTAPVQQNYLSTDKTQPRVWYQRESSNTELFDDGTPGMVDVTYAVEVQGLDIDSASAIADTITSAMNGFRGIMGGSVVLGCFVSDASDEYQPRGLSRDDGYNILGFTMRILT